MKTIHTHHFVESQMTNVQQPCFSDTCILIKRAAKLTTNSQRLMLSSFVVYTQPLASEALCVYVYMCMYMLMCVGVNVGVDVDADQQQQQFARQHKSNTHPKQQRQQNKPQKQKKQTKKQTPPQK